MKAVVIAPELAAPDGGIPRILRLYLTALVEDPAVKSLALASLYDRPSELARLPIISAARTRDKPLATSAAAGSKTAFAREAWSASSSAARIVCGHVDQLPVAALALRPGGRLALIAHGIETWETLPAAQRLALGRVDRVFCASAYTRDRLASNYPALRPRLRIVPYALDPALFEGTPPWLAPLGKAPVILCVGRLRAAEVHKAYPVLLQALARLNNSALHHHGGLLPRLRFVGEGDAVERMRGLAADLRIADRVEFSGRLSDADLLGALADCTCFALPSTGEGFGLGFLEAMAAGRPGVGVQAGAVPELLTREVGVLAPPNDPEAFAAALTECLARFWNPTELRRIALNYSYTHFRSALSAAWG